MKERLIKALSKRLLAFALMMAMVVTLLPGMSMTAKAEVPALADIFSMMEGKMYLDSNKSSYIWYYPGTDWICYDKYEDGEYGNYSFQDEDSITGSEDPDFDYKLENSYNIFYFKLDNNNITKVKLGSKLAADAALIATEDTDRETRLSSILGMLGDTYMLETSMEGMAIKGELNVNDDTFSMSLYMADNPSYKDETKGKFVNVLETGDGWKLFWFKYKDDELKLDNLEVFELTIVDGRVTAITAEGELEYNIYDSITKYDLYVGKTQVTEENAPDILGNGTASYDADSNTLTLKGVNIGSNYYESQRGEKYAIYANDNNVADYTLNIVLSGNNKIGTGNGTDSSVESYYSDAPNVGIYVLGNISVSGSGNIEIIDKDDGISANGGDIIFGSQKKPFNGKVTILDYGKVAQASCAISSYNGIIALNGGQFDLKSVIREAMYGKTISIGDNVFLKAYSKEGYPVFVEDGALQSTQSVKGAGSESDTNKVEVTWKTDRGGYVAFLDGENIAHYVEIGKEPTINTNPIHRPSTSTDTNTGNTVPVSGEGTSNATVSVSGNNATVSIGTNAINNAAGNTTQHDTDTITVDLSGLKETVTSTTISKTDATNLATTLNSASNNKQYVEFKMAEYTVKVDATAMSAVAKAATGSDLRLVVETTTTASKLNTNQKAEIAGKEVARTFEAYFVSNGTRIGTFNGGTVQVGVVKFNVPSGKDAKYYHIEYLPETGKAERYKTRYSNGNLIFNTTHFSDYAIVYDETAANDTGVLAYRLYDKNRGEHIYTVNKAERDMLVNAGWIDETKADGSNSFYASVEKTGTYDTAVYRAYNPYNANPSKSAHMYTKNASEYRNIVNGGWEKDAGIVFYVAGTTAGGANKVVYRAYNPNSPSGEHQWTVRKAEMDMLLKEGWVDETKENAWYSPAN